MNKEEFKECSVVAYPREIKFLHINGGAISYYVDRHVSDYVDRLQKENQKYKEVIDTIKNILNNQMNYREFVDIVNAIEDVVKEVE